jgi:adenylate cyclase
MTGAPRRSRNAGGPGRDRDTIKRRRWSVVLVAVLSMAAVSALSHTSPWRLVEARTFDYLSTILPPPRPAGGPIVVAIDEPSFAEIGRQWPWPRDLHASLVTALRAAGASAIGLDIVFAEPSLEAADAALVAAMGPDVALAADESLIETPHATQFVRVEPLPALIEAGARAGNASVVLDGDGTLRRLPHDPDGFAAVLLRAAGTPAIEVPAGALIQSFGPARHYPTVSYYQALDPENFLPPGLLERRIALVGLSLQSAPTVETGGADAFATSWTPRTGRLVSGAEIQATILDNLAYGLWIAPAPLALALAVNVLAALLAMAAIWRGTGWRTVVATLGAVAIGGVGGFLVLRIGRVYLPPLSPVLVFAATAAAQGARDFAAERRMRRQITRAFSHYLSPVMVERLAADPSRLKLGGEKRVLTVLFCDIRGFTSIAEAMKDDPQRLTALVNRVLEPLADVVLEAGGTIDKYMGDAIMAFWNAPLDDPDHAAHAVGAALDMVRAIERVNAELATEEPAPPRIGVGVGVNTGECVVGNLGSDKRFDYSALGDAVNLASRLEGQTRVYEVPVLIGEETARLVAGRFPLAGVDRVSVKGKVERVAASTVIAGAGEEDLAAHAAMIADLDAGRHHRALARLEGLKARLPALAGYYGVMERRLAGD